MNYIYFLVTSFIFFSSNIFNQTEITDKLWRLEYANIKNKQVYFSKDEMNSPNILFYDQKIRGNSGCNAYHSSYEMDPYNNLKINSIISTKMACAKTLKLAESDYITALQSPLQIEYQSDIQILTLKNSKGDVLRYFLQGEKKR